MPPRTEVVPIPSQTTIVAAGSRLGDARQGPLENDFQLGIGYQPQSGNQTSRHDGYQDPAWDIATILRKADAESRVETGEGITHDNSFVVVL
jgi:hypothetical protein